MSQTLKKIPQESFDDFDFVSEEEASFFTLNQSIRTSELQGHFRHLAMVFERGQEIGNFEIRKVLGYGGFGIVYLAYDKSLGRNVALKVSSRANREAQTMAQLEHEGIVRVHSHHFDSIRSIQLIAMQRVAGTTLEKLLKKIEYETPEHLTGETLLSFLDALSAEADRNDPAGTDFRNELSLMSFEQVVLSIFAKIAQALDYAHRQGVLHLDIKPGNILLSPYGLPLLGDFNVSASGEQDRPRGGTKAYMSPEQLHYVENGKMSENPIDARSDLYAFGIVLKEVFARARRPVSSEIDNLITRCTQPEPAKRYSSAGQIAEEISAILNFQNMVRRLEDGRLNWVARKFPFTTLSLVALLPQFIASYIHSGYYLLRIASSLGSQQRDALDFFHYIYFPGVYGLVIAAWTLMLWPLLKRREQLSSEERSRLRKKSLRLPWLSAYLTIASWFPASIIFPIMVSQWNHQFEPEMFGHFLFSFAMCSLISSSYCYLYSRYILLRVFYPALLTPRAFYQGASAELRNVEKETKLFQRLPILVPLIGASVIALQGPVGDPTLHNEAFRNLIVALNAAGIAGIFLSGYIAAKLAKLVAVLARN